jgi:hypothetical protein
MPSPSVGRLLESNGIACQKSAVAFLLLERPKNSWLSTSVPFASSKVMSPKFDVVVGLDIDKSTCFTRKGWGMRYSDPDSIPPTLISSHVGSLAI